MLHTTAETQRIVHRPIQGGLPRGVITRAVVLGEAPASRQRNRLRERQILDERHRHFGEEILEVQEARHGELLVEARDETRLQATIGLEVEIEFAVARAHGSLHGARRDLEEIAGCRGFDHGLFDHRQVLGLEADVVAASLTDLGTTKEVQTAGAQRTTAVSGIEQLLRAITTDVAALNFCVDRAAVGCVDVVVPGTCDITRRARDQLPHVVGVETRTTTERVEALSKSERCGGVGSRSEKGLERSRNERVGHRDRETRGATSRSRSQLLQRVVVRVNDASVRFELVVDLKLDVGIEAPTLHRQHEDVRRFEVVREEVREKRSGNIALGAGVADHVARRVTTNTGAEQRTIGIETETGRTTVGVALVRSEERVNSGLRRRCRTRHPRTTRENGGGAARLGGKTTRTLVDRVTAEVARVEHGAAATIGELATHGDVRAPLLTIFFFGETVLRVDGEAIKTLLHDEVDDTRHGVRTVGRSGTAGDDLDALDESSGNRVDVHRAGAGRTHRATTVDEHEVTARTESTQVDDRTAAVARVVRL